MYGSFDDVTADEYLSVQLDMSEFRLSWDKSSAQCYVLDKDTQTGGIVYYWEVNWPRFFSNRDYCCYRYIWICFLLSFYGGLNLLSAESTLLTQSPGTWWLSVGALITLLVLPRRKCGGCRTMSQSSPSGHTQPVISRGLSLV